MGIPFVTLHMCTGKCGRIRMLHRFTCILGLRIAVVLDIIRHSTDTVYIDSQRADLLHGKMEAG